MHTKIKVKKLINFKGCSLNSFGKFDDATRMFDMVLQINPKYF